MLMLGIETSCDETAAAVVEEASAADASGGGPSAFAEATADRRSLGGGWSGSRWILRSNVVASQADIHREWGGVVPELASRQHVRDICGVVERALEQASVRLDDID